MATKKKTTKKKVAKKAPRYRIEYWSAGTGNWTSSAFNDREPNGYALKKANEIIKNSTFWTHYRKVKIV